MGARAYSRSRAAPARRISRENASTTRDGRTPVRHDQSPYGRHPLPDEDASTGRRRDGPTRPGLQYDAGHKHLGRPIPPGGIAGVTLANNPLTLIVAGIFVSFDTTKTQSRLHGDGDRSQKAMEKWLECVDSRAILKLVLWGENHESA